MSAKPLKERRHGPRVALAFQVEISGIGVHGTPYCDHATATDVSDRGCQVHLTREVRPGDLLTLRVMRRKKTGDHDGPFLYQTVWVEPAESGGWVAGLVALEAGNPWHVHFPQESLMRE